MRIVVNDIAAEYGGALTILRQFYNYIKGHCQDDEWIFLLGDKLLEETDNIKILTFPEVKRSHWRKVWFDCVGGHTVIDNMHPDVVLSLQNIITFGVKAPQAVYVHQSIPFQSIRNFSFFKRDERSIAFIQKVIGAFIKKSVKSAQAVIVQTPWMREAVARKANIPLDKITVARPDCEPPPQVSKADFSSRRFFYPTNNGLYKNNEAIIEACNILVSKGITDFTVELTLPKGTFQHHNVTCIGYLDRLELFKRYASSVLLFPSYIETVGLPLQEAASLGMPIIAADCPHVHDILQNYSNVSYFSPFNYKALASCMENSIMSASPKSSLFIDYDSEWSIVIRKLKSIERRH